MIRLTRREVEEIADVVIERLGAKSVPREEIVEELNNYHKPYTPRQQSVVVSESLSPSVWEEDALLSAFDMEVKEERAKYDKAEAEADAIRAKRLMINGRLSSDPLSRRTYNTSSSSIQSNEVTNDVTLSDYNPMRSIEELNEIKKLAGIGDPTESRGWSRHFDGGGGMGGGSGGSVSVVQTDEPATKTDINEILEMLKRR
jgi:hypothetical protein